MCTTTADGHMTEEQKQKYVKSFEAKLISPAEIALGKRGASNAGLPLPRLREDLRDDGQGLR